MATERTTAAARGTAGALPRRGAASSSARSGTTGLDLVLGRLGDELARLRDLSLQMEGSLGAPALLEADVGRLQGLDVLTQHLGAASAICHALAGQVRPGEAVDLGRACAGLGLQGLSDRLAGRPEREAETGGVVELF